MPSWSSVFLFSRTTPLQSQVVGLANNKCEEEFSLSVFIRGMLENDDDHDDDGNGPDSRRAERCVGLRRRDERGRCRSRDGDSGMDARLTQVSSFFHRRTWTGLSSGLCGKLAYCGHFYQPSFRCRLS